MVTKDRIRTYSVADLFCGAGGSSTGAEHAITAMGARMDLVAINHWDTAIATHQANHPEATHYVEDVSVVDPERIVPSGKLDLLMASPECKFYSRARGGKPVHDQGRMNPWAVHNWLTKLNVRTVLIENVPEFIEWGPLLRNGKPDKRHKGEHFEAWLRTFWNLGYTAEWRMLNAADYGDATTRVRFFLLARKDGKPITWPEPSHAKGDTGMFKGRARWRPARDIIDWSDTGRSLLDDPKYQKKQLSEKTRLRIAKGLERFGGPLAPLYIRLLGLPDYVPSTKSAKAQPFVNSDRQHTVARSADEPVHTITTLTGGGQYLVQPDAIRLIGANRTHNVPKDGEPMPPATTGGGGGVFLVEASAETTAFMLGQQGGGAPRSVGEPTPTITTDGAIAKIEPSATAFTMGQHGTNAPHSIDDPIPTVATVARIGLVQSHVTNMRGRSIGSPIDAPLPTESTSRHLGLVGETLVRFNGESGPESVDEPLSTIDTRGRHGLAEAILVQTAQTGGNGAYVRSVDQPLPTITTHNDMGVVEPGAEPFLVAHFGEAEGQEPRVHSVDEPTPAITSRGGGELVMPGIVEPVLRAVKDGNLDPDRVVLIDGVPYLLDIRFRMLRNPELARAMGFSDEQAEYEFEGNITEVTKQIGNAVPVHMAQALVGAILGT